MQEKANEHEELFRYLGKNVKLVTFYYKLSAFLFFTVILLHICFSAWVLLNMPSKDISQVTQFTVFNAALLVVEVFLGRIAFMLGSRSGQLMDLRIMLLLAGPKATSVDLETIAKTIMSLRRDMSGLKIVDVEELLRNIKKS